MKSWVKIVIILFSVLLFLGAIYFENILNVPRQSLTTPAIFTVGFLVGKLL